MVNTDLSGVYFKSFGLQTAFIHESHIYKNV